MHILVVDDEPVVREILTRFLHSAGFATREAGNTEEALASLAAEPAAVALCDVQMPGEHDGVWLTNEIRRRYFSTAVVLVTGVDSVPPTTSMQAGVIAYLVKPFTSAGVIDAAKRAVAWHEETEFAGPRADTLSALDAWFAEMDAADLG
jgi:two-component system nitrogen regulation response regulator NtrX